MNHFEAGLIADALAEDMFTENPTPDDIKRWRDWAREIVRWCEGSLASQGEPEKEMSGE